jgi:hypothetical protein
VGLRLIVLPFTHGYYASTDGEGHRPFPTARAIYAPLRTSTESRHHTTLCGANLDLRLTNTR